MRNYSVHQVLGVVDQIKKTDDMIRLLESKAKNPVMDFNIWQLKELKKDFVKELIACLVQSDIALAELEPFLKSATTYLKKFEANRQLDSDLKSNLQEVEKMMAA